MAIRFPIEDLRPLGRSARGVNSMKLRSADTIIGCDIVPRNYDADLLVVTSDGFGKRTKLSEFRSQNRGGIGLIATKFKSSMSRLVALTIVEENNETEDLDTKLRKLKKSFDNGELTYNEYKEKREKLLEE
jgi:DNA gyrase subunit A